MKIFLSALSFLTIFPVPAGVVNEQSLQKSIIFFPLIGILLGAISSIAVYFAYGLLPVQMTAVLLVVLNLALTRGLHIDGLADTFDGFLGGRNPEHALKIMKDPSTGAFGTAAIASDLLCRFAAYELILMNFREPSIYGIMLFAPSVARWTPALLSFVSPPVPARTGLGNLFAKKINLVILFFSLMPAMFAGILFLQLWAVMGMLGTIALVMALRHLAIKKIGGLTGDIYGCVIELTEVCVYTGAVIAYCLQPVLNIEPHIFFKEFFA